MSGGIHVAGDGRKYTLLVSSVHRVSRFATTTFPLVPPPSHSAGRRYCIVMLSAVGDAVHVLPVVNAIKRADLHSHITWSLQPGPAAHVGPGHWHGDGEVRSSLR